jgi:hypothetical protein
MNQGLKSEARSREIRKKAEIRRPDRTRLMVPTRIEFENTSGWIGAKVDQTVRLAKTRSISLGEKARMRGAVTPLLIGLIGAGRPGNNFKRTL